MPVLCLVQSPGSESPYLSIWDNLYIVYASEYSLDCVLGLLLLMLNYSAHEVIHNIFQL